jgi:hypothetical protein
MNQQVEGEARADNDAAPQPGGRPRRRWSLPSFVRELSPRTILVFVSSPGDCILQREIARSTIKRVNENAALVGPRIRFRALLWEDLPPGLAEKGDFQGRINALLKRYDYDDYGIYLGFFKGRLGTATPRYPSGTVEEFELSLKRRNRTGSPSELLVYFLEPESSRAAEVAQYRSSLAVRGFLTTSIPENAFEAQLERNLLDIARTWTGWRNRLRRIGPKAARVAAAAAGFVVLVAIGLNALSYWQVLAAVHAGDVPRAATIWRERSALMLVGRRSARSRINEAIAQSIGAEGELGRQLGSLRTWERDPIVDRDDPAIHRTRSAIAAEAQGALVEASYVGDDSLAYAAWRQGSEVELWSPVVTGELLATVAASRLVAALASSGIAPEHWSRDVLRGFEHDRLRVFALAVLKRSPDPAQWGADRRRRLAVAVLAETPDAVMRLANDMLRQQETFEQPELDAWIALGPEGAVAAWIGRSLDASTPTPILGKIVDAVRQRKSPALLAALVDLSLRPQAPPHLASLLEDLTCIQPACSNIAGPRILEWVKTAAPISNGILALLPALDSTRLDSGARDKIVAKLARALNDNQSGAAIITALSRLATQSAKYALDRYRERHAKRDISFGFAERAALIDHLARENAVSGRTRLEQARSLIAASEADAQSIQAVAGAPGATGLGLVDRAYLDLLASQVSAAGDEDRQTLGRIVERIAAGVALDPSVDRLHALGRALRGLPEDWTLSLLRFRPGPVTDPPWDPLWDRRKLILNGLEGAQGRQMPNVARTALNALPVDTGLAAEIANAAASLSVEEGRRYYRHRLAQGDMDALGALARRGDREVLQSFAEAAARSAASSAELPKALSDSIAALDSASDRTEMCNLLIREWPGSLARLLPVAARDRIDHPHLRAMAESLLQRAESPIAMANAITYLASRDPLEPWRVAATLPVRDSVAGFLARADFSDWITVAQAFPLELPSGSIPAGAQSIVAARRVGVIMKQPATPNIAEAGVLVLADDQIMLNHLLATWASKGQASATLGTIDLLARATSPIEVLPPQPDPSTSFQAYLSWLAAIPINASSPGCLSKAIFTPDHLIDGNPLVVRAAAAIALAAPTAAAARSACVDAAPT